MQISYFAMPMGLGGLAVAFKIASPWTASFVDAFLASAGGTGGGNTIVDWSRYAQAPHQWWWTFALIAAIAYCAMVGLYAARLLAYPWKCAKEWHHPWNGNAFALPGACLMLFAFLVFDIHGPDVQEGRQLRFARVMWWVGSVGNMLLTVLKLGEWVARPLALEHVNPGWLLIPCVNLLAALVAPLLPLWTEPAGYYAPLLGLYQSNASVELASFFFSIGAFMWVVLFTITFGRVATGHNTQEPARGLAYVWLTPPTIGGLAYLVINLGRAAAAAPSAGLIASVAVTQVVATLCAAAACLRCPPPLRRSSPRNRAAPSRTTCPSSSSSGCSWAGRPGGSTLVRTSSTVRAVSRRRGGPP